MCKSSSLISKKTEVAGIKVNTPFPSITMKNVERRKTQCMCHKFGRLSRWNLICSFYCFPSSFWMQPFSFFKTLHLLMNCFGRSNLKSHNPVAIFFKTNHNITGLGMVWSRKRDVQVLESISLFFYQIFISQIISITKKAFCRAKGNLLPLLDKSPQVFGIARLSKVRTIQISKKIQCHWWNKQDFLQGMYINYGVYPLEVILFFF